MLSSFSNMVGVFTVRATAGWVGLMPYFCGRLVYWLGRRHDSNSASSRGVTARSEKPRILLLDRLQQNMTRTTANVRMRLPRTTARMIQIFFSSMVSVGGGIGVRSVDDVASQGSLDDRIRRRRLMRWSSAPRGERAMGARPSLRSSGLGVGGAGGDGKERFDEAPIDNQRE